MRNQQENLVLRNAFLSGAFELKNGIPEGASHKKLRAGFDEGCTGFTFSNKNKIEVKVKRKWTYTISANPKDYHHWLKSPHSICLIIFVLNIGYLLNQYWHFFSLKSNY